MIQFPLSRQLEGNAIELSEEQWKIVEEYYHLSLTEKLSEDEQEQMISILEIAETDGLIDFWINELDHIVAHKLNLINENNCKNGQALVREHILFPSEQLDEFIQKKS
jgi:hypothetical protein